MRAALTLALLAHLVWAGVPLCRALVPGAGVGDALLLGPGLSVGLFTWLLFWIGLAPGAPLAGWGAALAWALVAAAAHAAARRQEGGVGAWLAAPERRAALARELSGAAGAVWLVLAVFVGGGIFLNVYFPATHWDYLARYGLHARTLFESGRLTDAVTGYPPLAALFGCGVYAGCGAVVEELGKLHGPLHALLVLGLTMRLARCPRRPWEARLAALLLGLAPIFLNSIPSGDPDLALVSHATACLVVLLVPPAGEPARLALLCGLHLGLAVWAKQAALPFLASLGLLALLAGTGLVRHGWLSCRRLGGAVLVAALLAAPWYARNRLIGGPLVVVASANDSATADRSLASLAAPLRWWQDLGAPGAPFLFLGLVALAAAAVAPQPDGPRVPARRAALAVAALFALLQVTCGTGRAFPPFDAYLRTGGALAVLSLAACRADLGLAPVPAIALAWMLPLALAWWVKFSFTGRYLLPVLPPLAAAGARAASRMPGAVFRASPAAWALALPAAVLLTLEVYPLWHLTLAQALEAPGRTHAEKWEVYPGPLYRVAGWLAKEAPANARVATNDFRLAYFAPPGWRLTRLPATPAELAEVDRVVLGPFGAIMFASPEEVARAGAPVRALLAPRVPALSDGGYEVYRVR